MSELLPEPIGGPTHVSRIEDLTARLIDAYDQDADELEIARLNREIRNARTAMEYPEPPRFYQPGEHSSEISLAKAVVILATSYIRA